MKTLAAVILLVITVPLFSQDSYRVPPSVKIESIDHYPTRTFVAFTINGIPASMLNVKFEVLNEDQTFLYNGKFECTGNELYDNVMLYDPGTYRIFVYDMSDKLLCKSEPIVLK